MPLPTSLFSSYETVKYAHIQDARLGMTRWILLVGITLYVVVIEMLQMGGYLESDPVVGVVRFSLQQPTLNNCDPAAPNCANAFAPLTTLNYCQQSHQAYNGTMYPCEIYEAVNAQVLRETSVVVWTRATTYNQSLICDGSMDKGITCPRTYQNNQHDDGSIPSPFYIAQSEAFTILLEHAVTASKICEHNPDHYSCSAQAKDYRGCARRNLSKTIPTPRLDLPPCNPPRPALLVRIGRSRIKISFPWTFCYKLQVCLWTIV
jgi:hypothetical protein